LRIEGRGLRGLVRAPSDVIDAGNPDDDPDRSGILRRPAVLSVITGESYLRRRPMGRVIDPLTRMGASILGRDGNRLPPLCIRGGRSGGSVPKCRWLRAGEIVPVLAAVRTPRSRWWTDAVAGHTERMLAAMGAG